MDDRNFNYQSDDFIRHQANYALRRDEKGRLTFKRDKKLQSTELHLLDWLWEYLNQVICLLVHGIESDMLATEVAKTAGGSLAFSSTADVERAGYSVPGDNLEAFEAAVRKFLSGIELRRN